MSGTSLDGTDATLVDFSAGPPAALASARIPFPESLRGRLAALCGPGPDGLDEAGACNVELADAYAQAVHACLDSAGIRPSMITAIGCHGQTVRHRPERGFTLQLGDPARLAERTGIDVVADFRRRDMAAGGQGAPLVPAFHDVVFRHPDVGRAVANIGGISNVSLLAPGQPVSGFDCGPGNVLMDAWIARHLGSAFDEEGRWAATGVVDAALLERLLDDPFFARHPPKSTGRELFNLDWLGRHLPGSVEAADVQATLLDLTARSIAQAIDRYGPATREVYLCGGGARNTRLSHRIGELAPGRRVLPTDVLGVPAGQVEPVAFAWLAHKFVLREPLDLSAITGARHPCLLGALYPA
jgi:anhydro-N-acetylmuramic acid kinase